MGANTSSKIDTQEYDDFARKKNELLRGKDHSSWPEPYGSMFTVTLKTHNAAASSQSSSPKNSSSSFSKSNYFIDTSDSLSTTTEQERQQAVAAFRIFSRVARKQNDVFNLLIKNISLNKSNITSISGQKHLYELSKEAGKNEQDARRNNVWCSDRIFILAAAMRNAQDVEIAEWTFTITSQSVVEKIGVAVTQGSLTGTLKTALTGDSTSINIESALGITFLTTADLVVGSTTVAHTNIATAKVAILRGPAKLKLRTLDFSNCDDLDQSYVSNDYFVNHNEYLEIMSKVSVKLRHGPRKNDIIFGSIDTARVPNNTVNVLYDDNKISYGVPSRYVLNNNQKSKKQKNGTVLLLKN